VGLDPGYAAEHFALYAGTSADPDEMTQVLGEQITGSDYVNYTADLADFVGEEAVYVAIRHFNISDMFILDVDDVEILTEGEAPEDPDPEDPDDPPATGEDLEPVVAEITAEQVDHAIHCVCEAAGKATFTDNFAKEGLRQWMGVPHSIGPDDGRLMGGYLEMFLQCYHIPYEIEAFNKKECIYTFDPSNITVRGSLPRFKDAFIWFWYGTVKSLVNAQWSLWEEDSPEGRVRVKIAKRVDKFC
jgi:hypothetical protein